MLKRFPYFAAALLLSSFAFTQTGSGSNATNSNTAVAETPKQSGSAAIRSAKLEFLKPIRPKYPTLCVSARIQGQVVLRAFVNEDGRIANVRAFSGHPMLTPAAVDAVNRAQFKPFVLDGHPMAFETELVINFTLSPSGSDRVEVQEPGAPEINSERLYALHSERPAYPKDVADNRSASVVVKITLDEHGTVTEAEAIEGDEAFRSAAEQAARKWRFIPFLRDGKPSSITTKLTLEFPGEGAPERVRVSQGVAQGMLVRKVNPEFPMAARMRGDRGGTVVLSAIIGRDGKIRDVKVVSGPAEFCQAAADALRQWEYKPYMLNGKPVEVETQVTMAFNFN